MQPSQQLPLFPLDDTLATSELDARLWRGSFNKRESTLQQLSPYVGKMKSGMAHAILSLYTASGDIVLDPFAGSGVVPLEAALMGRQAWANDLSPYAYTLTRGKLETPTTKREAMDRAQRVLERVDQEAPEVSLRTVPNWVREFFHPDTLREILITLRILREQEDYFLTACLLGILHHVRPGFLSYPASHLVPYLRTKKYPPEDFPAMYTYRDVRSRLLAKVERAYRRSKITTDWQQRHYRVWQVNAMQLPIQAHSVDAIVSSPPYFGALDYARDNRLRLWFLGCEDWKQLDASLTASAKVYLEQMAVCLREMDRVLKPGKYCVLVLGDVDREGKTRRTAEILADLARDVSDQRLSVVTIYDDRIPDDRRSRRRTKTTKFERILVMQKGK